MVLPFAVWAHPVWTVPTVPNTRLEGNDIHVSDPDGFLSDSTERVINVSLGTISNQADVFLVTLASIGDTEPKRFATELFNHWGIGDAETDNGVLLLFVEDQHALEFETGYGAEATLTDAKCQRIFTNAIVPYFKRGDYEGGLCMGVAEIVEIFGGEIPLGLKDVLPSGDNKNKDGKGDYGWAFTLFALIAMALPIMGVAYWLHKRKVKPSVPTTYDTFEEGDATYIEKFTSSWSGSPWEGKGCLGGLTLGFSIFVIMFGVILFFSFFRKGEGTNLQNGLVAVVTFLLYLTWVCFRQNHRALKQADQLSKSTLRPKEIYQVALNHLPNKVAMWMSPWLGWMYHRAFKKRIEKCHDCQCPKCASLMKEDKRFALPEIHKLEKDIGALKYTPYRCLNGHEYVLKDKGRQYKKFRKCEKCGAFASELMGTTITRKADYTQAGEKETVYLCQNCHEVLSKTVVIPKKKRYVSSGYYSGSSSGGSYSSSSSGSRYSGSSYSGGSSHSSGGSFGGGHSGGGGYSGRW